MAAPAACLTRRGTHGRRWRGCPHFISNASPIAGVEAGNSVLEQEQLDGAK
jgi:hypothetical protein